MIPYFVRRSEPKADCCATTQSRCKFCKHPKNGKCELYVYFCAKATNRKVQIRYNNGMKERKKEKKAATAQKLGMKLIKFTEIQPTIDNFLARYQSSSQLWCVIAPLLLLLFCSFVIQYTNKMKNKEARDSCSVFLHTFSIAICRFGCMIFEKLVYFSVRCTTSPPTGSPK